MVDWDRTADMTRRATSAVFDTFSCRMIPMTRGLDLNRPAAPDGARQAFDFAALLDKGPSQDAIPRHLPADPGARGTMVSYDTVMTALVGGWPWLPKKGDRVRVLVAKGLFAAGSEFEFMAGEEDGSERRAFYLNQVKD
jgi:hypothetical protein